MGKVDIRLTPTAATIKKLLLRSGNQCAFPSCTAVLFDDKDVLVAQCCHIEAANAEGQRYNADQTPQQRRAYENLLFLCHKHHRETDDISLFDVAAMRRIKSDHEARFSEKSFVTNTSMVSQARESLDVLISTIYDTSETIKRMEQQLTDVLMEKPRPPGTEKSQYFGLPKIQHFSGRSKEMGELYYGFASYNTFVIGGISGTGKSTLTVKFLSEQADYRVLWIDCKTIDTIELFHNEIAEFCAQEFGDQQIAHVLRSIDQQRVIKTIIGVLSGKKCCIVFDGLDEHMEVFLPMLKQFNQYLDSTKLFLSTTSDLEIHSWSNPVYKTALKGLDYAGFSAMAIAHGLKNISDEDNERLYMLIQGHPYLLKLSITLLQYQPVQTFLGEISEKGSTEIDGYLRERAIEKLSATELRLLQKLVLFKIPFRYAIGKFIQEDNFDALFRTLKNKYLIASFQEEFFDVPELLRSTVMRTLTAQPGKHIYSSFVSYLQSLGDQVPFFEHNGLVYHASCSGQQELAKKTAHSCISALMGTGRFALALSIATNYNLNEDFKNWPFLYFIMGRVLRFQEDFNGALAWYEVALSLGVDDTNYHSMLSEKASVLALIADENDDPVLLEQAKQIYRSLIGQDWRLTVQSTMSMVLIRLGEKDLNGLATELLTLKDDPRIDQLPSNTLAALWQTIGDVHQEEKRYADAFSAYDTSIDFYNIAIKEFGMNVIDGLFHLYGRYAWNYVKVEDFHGAVEMFACRLGLCEEYDLGLKRERALFDLGYHLILIGDYQKAADVLSEHYQYVRELQMEDEMDQMLVLGGLAFSHWYSGDFLNAVELMALLIIQFSIRGLRPAVMVMERSQMTEEIDVMKFFKKRAYTFIIPAEKSLADFNAWAEEVSVSKPHLKEVLTSFKIVDKNSVADGS